MQAIQKIYGLLQHKSGLINTMPRKGPTNKNKVHKMKTLGLLVILFGMAVSSFYLVSQFNKSQDIFNKHNVCTSKLVAQGVERSQIVRLNGFCSVK